MLAPISKTDMADWHTLVEHMKPFPDRVLRDLVRGMDDLLDAARSDEVRYAISVPQAADLGHGEGQRPRSRAGDSAPGSLVQNLLGRTHPSQCPLR